jgi:mannose/fructose-specific phosphotransferase system component IIA
MAVRRLQRERPGLTIVMGVNLPMLLEFVLHDPLTGGDLAAAVERSRALMQILDTPHVR